jgi:hypothetical protein
MSQGTFFEIESARAFQESETKQQEALSILRHRKLTKLSFERDWSKDGCRLAPAIDILRNGWGFEIAGNGSKDDPYWLLNPDQSPAKVRTTSQLKDLYWECDHWAKIRDRRWQHDNFRCVLCVASCRDSIRCHHVVYNLFNETLDQVMTVCEFHHKMIHAACFLKFPTGIETWIAERLLGVIAYPFEEWLLP